MSELHPLLHLPQSLPHRRQAIALQAGRWIGAAEFARDIGCALATLNAHGAAQYALHTPDCYRAAVWLLAALCAGRPLLLPGDATPATLATLRDEGWHLLGDAPGALDDWSAHAPAALPTELDGAARILIQTSGSTGQPQRIVKTLAQTEAEAMAIERALGESVSPEAIVAGSVPHQHLYGLSFRLIWPLSSGRSLLAQALPGPETLWALPAGHRAVFVTSPALLKRLPDTLAWDALPALQCVLSAGSPLPREAAIDAADKLGCPVSEIYGSSETGAIGLRRGPDTPWRMLPGADWKIVDGCLSLRAPWLASADWYRSADRAESCDGSFRLCGRADRIAKVEDKRISLGAIESALCKQPEISEARCLVLNGARSEVAAVAVLSAAGRTALESHGKGALDRRLRAALTASVEPLGLPRRWRYVDAMPQDSLGKVTEAALAARFAPALQLWPRVLSEHRTERALNLRLGIDAALAHFDGHFAAAPILPGVAQIDWAMHFGRAHFALPPDCLRLEVVKFQQVIRPGSEVELQLDWNAERGSLAFEYRSGERRHASGRLILGTAS